MDLRPTCNCPSAVILGLSLVKPSVSIRQSLCQSHKLLSSVALTLCLLWFYWFHLLAVASQLLVLAAALVLATTSRTAIAVSSQTMHAGSWPFTLPLLPWREAVFFVLLCLVPWPWHCCFPGSTAPVLPQHLLLSLHATQILHCAAPQPQPQLSSTVHHWHYSLNSAKGKDTATEATVAKFVSHFIPQSIPSLCSSDQKWPLRHHNNLHVSCLRPLHTAPPTITAQQPIKFALFNLFSEQQECLP